MCISSPLLLQQITTNSGLMYKFIILKVMGISSIKWAHWAKIKRLAGLALLEGLGKTPFSCLLQFLEASQIPWPFQLSS